jgi:DNA-binding transcriptional LysR family regulator
MTSLQQLRHVIALAEHRHFARAAGSVGITQAALSLSIQKLEAVHGVQLFERRQGEVTVTAFGEVVLDAALAAVSRVTHMRREIALMRKLATGRLIVGCDPHFAEAIVAPALTRLLNTYPRLEFTIEPGGWESMRERLLTKEIDLYLGFENKAEEPRLVMEAHSLPPFVTFCRAGHPLLERGSVTIRDVLQYPTAVPPTSRWLQQRVRPVLEEAGLQGRIPPYLVSSDYSIIRAVVRGSEALGLAPLRTIAAELADGSFRRFLVPELNFDISITIASLRGRHLPPAAQALLDDIRTDIESSLES